jgi:hypothetical protein
MAMTQVTVHAEFSPTGTRPRPEDFPGTLRPVDDLPPVTVITHVRRAGDGILVVRGTSLDNVAVKRVLVNGSAARQLAPEFGEWEAVVRATGPGPVHVSAHAEDAAGNVEPRPHVVVVP